MKDILSKITIVLISYKSSLKLKKFIKNIPPKLKILIIDNSRDYQLKKIFKNNKYIKIFFKKNLGYGSSINYASKKIKSKYFFVVQPDVIGINKFALLEFYKYAEILENKFSVIGPHYKNASKKGHFQTNVSYKIKEIHNVHGSTMFFNHKVFKKIRGFDVNIFLYWEETDYTKRAKKMGYNAYQLNTVKVKHEKGKAVEVKNEIEKNKLANLYTWHFIWSKYYYFNKHYGKLVFLYFLPIMLRIFYRLIINKKNKKNYIKYSCRWDGLKKSFLNKKSSMRLEKIPEVL